MEVFRSWLERRADRREENQATDAELAKSIWPIAEELRELIEQMFLAAVFTNKPEINPESREVEHRIEAIARKASLLVVQIRHRDARERLLELLELAGRSMHLWQHTSTLEPAFHEEYVGLLGALMRREPPPPASKALVRAHKEIDEGAEALRAKREATLKARKSARKKSLEDG